MKNLGQITLSFTDSYLFLKDDKNPIQGMLQGLNRMEYEKNPTYY